MTSHLILFVSFFLISLLQSPTFAVKKSYVVYLGGHSHGSEVTEQDLHRVTDSHHQLLGSYVGSQRAKEAIFYSYTRHINGFAAILEEEEAEALSKDPGVVSFFLNIGRKLHTTRSWEFMGLEKDGAIPLESAWKKARFGEDTIIANLDTGVWPESPSFNDEGLGPVPSKWKGLCQNNTKIGVPCNRKLIGARYFNKGYMAAVGSLNESSSARDNSGHGSHTLSTAGGSFAVGANLFGLANGTAKGGSPRARVAAYKVCWPPTESGECFDADILAAIDAAIHDGVDVISISLGGPSQDYFHDAISIGSFHAVKKGIVVVSSAGNEGPYAATVENLSPWIFTIAASSVDRKFTTHLSLGNQKHFEGMSFSDKVLPKKLYPLITGDQASLGNASTRSSSLCQDGTLDPKKVKGKILGCLTDGSSRVKRGLEAVRAGAVGMVMVNDVFMQDELFADAHILPAIQITYRDGVSLFNYTNSTKSPTAYLTRPTTLVGTRPAPVMAQFSSRGPNTVTQEILKPDITAPGVDIIASFSKAISPTEEKFDKRRVLFFIESGTSMACPHVAGIAGLLKTLHPDWSPAAIKSSIMTTASTKDNNGEPIHEGPGLASNPFGYGSGHLRPNEAMEPGLVYDLTTTDYLNFLCAIGYNETQIAKFSDGPYKCPKSHSVLDFNYPSITVPNLNGSITVTRRVKNVGTPASTYHAVVESPPGISIDIKPKTLKFQKSQEEKTFKVTLKAEKANVSRDYVFGSLLWTDDKHFVTSPIVVKHVDI